jgi:tetratricopeptide (TPR) repeat protein
MASTEERKERVSVREGIISFIQKYRKGLIGGAAAIVVFFVALVAGLTIRDTLQSKAIQQVEDFNDRYEALRFDISDLSKEGEVTALLDELTLFAGNHSAYAGGRAYAIIGSINADRKNWAEAEQAWTQAARKTAKTYLAPVSLFNAAVAAEEQGNIPQAIALYTESIGYGAEFPAAARAQFAIGRLQEEQRNKEGALEAYRAVIESWPSETIWTSLANSRIIALE